MSLAVVNGGNYLVELDTGFLLDGFVLDSATKAILDTDTLDETKTYADITQYAEQFSIRRGRQNKTDQFPTGTATLVFNDSLSGQALNPFNTTSPYYNNVDDLPGLAPLREMRISRNGQFLFKGRIQTYDTEYVLGGQDTVTVTCADDMFVLAQTELAEFTPTDQTSSARVSTVLARPEVNFTGATSITPYPVATLGAYLVANGTKTIEYLNDIRLAEAGRLFCDRENTLVFQPRVGITGGPVVATFDDTGTGLAYNDLVITFQSTDVINRASITRTGGVTQVATDAASIAYYYTQSVTNTNSLLSTDAEALTLADYLLTPNPEPLYTSVQTYFGSLSDPDKDIAAVIDIGDVITISATESFGTVAQTSFVEGVEIQVNTQTGQTMRFYTSPADFVIAFLLDDAIYGILDTTTPQPVLT